eukprot:TRINITY_DN77498_c0_g1_i1.p1 TRINITY_DN77498_c0_g1~~TRINITY_DN77498_c0_g1_i1.p1  ORF type:complete len:396 (+),score=41.83 TRINITY_DN77498_c0_g1_i1:180-1367(+)
MGLALGHASSHICQHCSSKRSAKTVVLRESVVQSDQPVVALPSQQSLSLESCVDNLRIVQYAVVHLFTIFALWRFGFTAGWLVLLAAFLPVWFFVRRSSPKEPSGQRPCGNSIVTMSTFPLGEPCSQTGQAMLDIQRRADDTLPPDGEGKLQLAGWRNASPPTAKVFLKFQKRPPRVLVSLDLKSQDQVSSFPLLVVDGKRVKGGAMPIFWCIGSWPSWFPFCVNARRIAQPAPDRAFWVVKFKIGLMTTDLFVFTALMDRLDIAGCVDMVMMSPPTGSEGKKWMGVTVPEHTAQYRVELVTYRISVFPSSMSSARVRVQSETGGALLSSIEWISLVFWRTVSSRVAPLIVKVQHNYDGSEIDHYLNGSQEGRQAERQMLFDLAGRLQASLRELG